MFRAASRLLSIYPKPDPEIILVETPSQLEKQIGVARVQTLQAVSEARAHVQGWIDRWIGIEHAVENRVKSIISPQESLTPGLLYVGIAALSGSIIARNRFLVTRLILPPTLLVLSANHFLPKTTTNLREYFASLEDTYFPTFSEKHEIAKAHSSMTWERIKEATASGREHINHGAVVLVDKTQEVTGLKIRETLGWGGEAKKRDTLDKGVEAAKEKVEKKVEEVKRIV
ncbi:apolipo protein O-domain-containing protein [Cyathus striatus]|nr:apolipo protein O-domain-containing protein [Cyathus striatus]